MIWGRVGRRRKRKGVGTPSDNPDMESFFGRLKDEFTDVFAAAKTESEVIGLIDKALLYYNEKRRHAGHDYLAPDAFIGCELAAVTAQYRHSP